MRNAIDTEAFAFDCEKREQLREAMGISDELVIGNVARFSYQKNHEYLLDIFSSIIKIYPNSVLMLIGRGELFDEVKRKARSFQIENRILFLGVRNDVSELLNAMDAFVLPSRFEGLPVTLVEVQANGLPTWVSDRVTKEIKIADSMHYMSIDEDANEWASAIIQSKLKREKVDIETSGYSIKMASKELAVKYRSLIV